MPSVTKRLGTLFFVFVRFCARCLSFLRARAGLLKHCKDSCHAYSTRLDNIKKRGNLWVIKLKI